MTTTEIQTACKHSRRVRGMNGHDCKMAAESFGYRVGTVRFGEANFAGTWGRIGSKPQQCVGTHCGIMDAYYEALLCAAESAGRDVEVDGAPGVYLGPEPDIHGVDLMPDETCETCKHTRPDGVRDLYPCNACRVVHLDATESQWEPKPERYCYQCRHNPSNRTDAPCAECWTWHGRPNWSPAETVRCPSARTEVPVPPVEVTTNADGEAHAVTPEEWEAPLYRVDENGLAHFTCSGTREDPAEREKYLAGLRKAIGELKQWLVPGDQADPNLSPPIRELDAKQCRSVANRFGYQLAVVAQSDGSRQPVYRQCGTGPFSEAPRVQVWLDGLAAEAPWRDALTAAADKAHRLAISPEGDRVYLGKLPKPDATS